MSKPKRCNQCRRVTKAKSHQGLCPACSVRKNKTVIRQMRKKKGKYYKAWKLNLLNAMRKQPM